MRLATNLYLFDVSKFLPEVGKNKHDIKITVLKKIPVRKKNGPVRKKNGPVRKKNGPVRKKNGPVRKKNGPVCKKNEMKQKPLLQRHSLIICKFFF